MRMYKETAVRLVPKEHQILKDDNGFVRHIVHDISEDLAERVISILDEEGEIVVRQFDLRMEEQKMLNRVEYRQNIMWSPLVRCKDCKWKPSNMGCNVDVEKLDFPLDSKSCVICPYGSDDPWYNKEPDPNGFCHKGERK